MGFRGLYPCLMPCFYFRPTLVYWASQYIWAQCILVPQTCTHGSFTVSLHTHLQWAWLRRLCSGTCSAIATLWREYRTTLDSGLCPNQGFPKTVSPSLCAEQWGPSFCDLGYPHNYLRYIYPSSFSSSTSPSLHALSLRKTVKTPISHPLICPFFSSPGSTIPSPKTHTATRSKGNFFYSFEVDHFLYYILLLPPFRQKVS